MSFVNMLTIETQHPALAAAPGFAPQSRVWVYVANRPLTAEEAQFAQDHLDNFARQWVSHNVALKAAGEVFNRQIILLMVDETHNSAGGCSIDKSTHFLEALGQRLGIDLFDRMQFAWVQGDALHFGNRDTLTTQVAQRQITDNTLMLNTMVQTKADLQDKWLLPFAQSWHRRLV